MGTVWRGREAEPDRVVAIKTLRPDRYTAEAAQRFLEEARNAARLFHPNIVRVHYNGPDDAPDPYFVMQYMEGPTLQAALREGPLPYERVVSLAHDLLAALGVAHRAGIIHRDVKPGNIFLENGQAVLGDFGISLAIDRTRDRDETAAPIGTPDYMAPERFRGDATPRSDLWAVGVVLWEACTGRRWDPANEEAWSQVPASLREPISRAVEWDQAARWPDAASFAAALPAVQEPDTTQPVVGPPGPRPPFRRGRIRRRNLAIGAAVAAAAALAGGAAWVWCCLLPFAPLRQVGLVVAPFDQGAGLPAALGYQIADRTAFYLHRLPGIGGPPMDVAARAWRSSDLPESERLAWLTTTTDVKYGIWGSVQLSGTNLVVQWRGYDTLTRHSSSFSVSGDSANLADLGDRVGFEIAKQLLQDSVRRTATPRFTQSAVAAAEFWQGEEAISRGAWKTAEDHYVRALGADSAFVRAKWRLGMVRRWSLIHRTFPPGFYPLDSIGRQSLTPTEAMLVDAQFAPTATQRFESYRQAIGSAPWDPYAALLYGDELFHRGPLVGQPLDSAVAMLGRASRVDPFLAPAWEHLAWAQIRLGRRDSAAAALAKLLQVSGPRAESWIYVPDLLRVAFALRFEGPAPAEATAALGSPENLALAARGAVGFDMPRYQLAFGQRLAAIARPRSQQQANGLVAQGVALVALGQPAAAFARFDSAAALFRSPEEALLQAAEWRVIPAALGLPGVSGLDRVDGRTRLAALAAGTGPRALRAAWALAVDAFLRGDTVVAHRWRAQVTGRTDSATEPLDQLLAALDAHARNEPGALDLMKPVLEVDSAGRQPDPFLRATVHLVRGQWADEAKDPALADASWLWYENTDAVEWPHAEAQPMDVDWALGAYAGFSRASLAFRRGEPARGCPLARRTLDFWQETEPGMAGTVNVLRTLVRGCPP